MPHDASDFHGAWKLVDWRIEYPDGAVSRPYGAGATGYILYTPEGIMSASIAKGGRPAFPTPNPRSASDAEKTEAFDNYFNYAGRWRIEDETVIHEVSIALNPNMAHTDQRRRAVFDGAGGLTLSAEEALSKGGARLNILQWRKA